MGPRKAGWPEELARVLYTSLLGIFVIVIIALLVRIILMNGVMGW
jgi:hypothetical protein